MHLAIQQRENGVSGSAGLSEGRIKEVYFTWIRPVEPCATWLHEGMDRFRFVKRKWEETQKGKSILVVEGDSYNVMRWVNAPRGEIGVGKNCREAYSP
ncbi:hypothetical protein ASPBRDRAFT_49123 [Aspergillus brasiliensis CBS 101740]|uniref:Uncharacterized protein n=1 Tax=Aspergillus brasiliensis (strain CBS 101740 / IMI 381727 / IBT 21946) TaxID=767769 RepID=A0A1L9U3U4_ASPBC|nr:hypothetical protein ASPBRDRAFT_49123 [Aspergillus brasiliensis CBS 101740]